MEEKGEFLYKDLSFEVIGCAFDAFKAVGVGYEEINYHKVFDEFLTRKGLRAKYKVPAHLDYLGKRIANFEIDEIVEDKLVVELKCIQTGFLPENFAQIISYLKLTNFRLGLLINFGLHRAFPKRVIFDAQKDDNFENWDRDFFQSVSAKKTIEAAIASMRNIDGILGPGYHSDIYKLAFGIEMAQNKIAYDDNVRINLKIENIQFNPVEIDYWLVDKSLLVGILAGTEKPRVYDLFRMRSYLKQLNLHHGLIAYWSTTNLQLFGFHNP